MNRYIPLEEKYQGWFNFETWSVYTYMTGNNKGYKVIKSYKEPIFSSTAQNMVLEIFPNGTPDMKSKEDYKKVNWRDIAEVFEGLSRYKNKTMKR